MEGIASSSTCTEEDVKEMIETNYKERVDKRKTTRHIRKGTSTRSLKMLEDMIQIMLNIFMRKQLMNGNARRILGNQLIR